MSVSKETNSEDVISSVELGEEKLIRTTGRSEGSQMLLALSEDVIFSLLDSSIIDVIIFT